MTVMSATLMRLVVAVFSGRLVVLLTSATALGAALALVTVRL